MIFFKSPFSVFFVYLDPKQINKTMNYSFLETKYAT